MKDRIKLGLVDGNEESRNKWMKLFRQSPELTLVASCASGQEALQLLPKHQAHVVLVDLHLPDNRSLDVVRELRRLSNSTLLLILTDGNNDKQLLEAIAAGAEAYLVTTSSPDHFLETVKWSMSGVSHCSGRLAGLILDRFPKPSTEPDVLTERERNILTQLASGRGAKEVSEDLHVNRYTLHTTVRTIFQKLAAHSQIGAPAQKPAPGSQ